MSVGKRGFICKLYFTYESAKSNLLSGGATIVGASDKTKQER